MERHTKILFTKGYKQFILLLLVCLTLMVFNLSCNYKLLVKKTDIIFNETGFLIYYQNTILFSKNNKENAELNEVLKKASDNSFFLNNVSEQQRYSIKKVSKFAIVNQKNSFEGPKYWTDTLYYAYFRIKGKPRADTYQNSTSIPIATTLIFDGISYDLYHNSSRYDNYYIYPESSVTMDEYVKYLYEYSNNH